MVLAFAAVSACMDPSPVRQVSADPAVLRAALGDWQEGPTDGRICLDPRALATDTAETGRARWTDAVLAALSTDTLIALDSSPGPLPRQFRRTCAPGRDMPAVAVGMPTIRGDSADITTAAFLPQTSTERARSMPSRIILVRQRGEWRIADYPDRRFQILAPPD